MSMVLIQDANTLLLDNSLFGISIMKLTLLFLFKYKNELHLTVIRHHI